MGTKAQKLSSHISSYRIASWLKEITWPPNRNWISDSCFVNFWFLALENKIASVLLIS